MGRKQLLLILLLSSLSFEACIWGCSFAIPIAFRHMVKPPRVILEGDTARIKVGGMKGDTTRFPTEVKVQKKGKRMIVQAFGHNDGPSGSSFSFSFREIGLRPEEAGTVEWYWEDYSGRRSRLEVIEKEK